MSLEEDDVTTEKATNQRWTVIATRSRPWLVVCGRFWDSTEDEVLLEEARCAVYYPPEARAVFGLAVSGPPKGSRISRAASLVAIPRDAIEIELEASPEAVERWRAEPWE